MAEHDKIPRDQESVGYALHDIIGKLEGQDRVLARLDLTINGNGTKDNPGLVRELDRHEAKIKSLSDDAKAVKKWVVLAIVGVFGAIGQAVMKLVMK